MTEEQYVKYKFIIYLICLPIISIIGVTGNSLSLHILQKYPTRHAFATYLKVLTCVDTILLCFSLIRSILKLVLYMELEHAATVDTYGTFYSGLIIGAFLQRLSSSFITVISLERFLAVYCPFRIRTMFIEIRPARITAIVICFHILLQVPTSIVVDVQQITVGNTTMHIISRTTAAAEQPILTSVYLFSIAVLGVALPLCFVLITTCCIIIRIKMRQTRNIMKHKVCRGSLETERMTFTLIVMATFFTIMSVPAVFIYVWSGIDRSVEYTYLRQLFVDIIIATTCMNSASDFIIYCLTSRSFRTLFCQRILSICEVVPPEERERQGDIHVIETRPSIQEQYEVNTKTSLTLETEVPSK